MSGAPQGIVLGQLLFLLYTAELFSVVENKLYGNADDSTLVTVVPSTGERVADSESMNHDLNRVSVLCNLCGIVSRSSTVDPQLTPLTLDGTVLKEAADLVILGVTFDAKMTFEKTFSLFPCRAAAQRLGMMRKS